MAEVISLASITNNNIDVRKLKTGLIQQADEQVEKVLAEEHAAEPIKNMDDLIGISQYLINNGRYRDNMLFIVGINFGLRVSDLRMLRFSDLITDDLVFKTSFPVFEIKTRNTRKHAKNRYVTINRAVIDAVTLYLENTDNVKLSDFMFRSDSNRNVNNTPLTRGSIDRLLKSIAKEYGLTTRVSTHTLRKSWAYHQMAMSNHDPRKLVLLQKMLNHSSLAQTLDYIGITNEEMEDAYMNLNLGSADHNYLIDSTIYEGEILSIAK